MLIVNILNIFTQARSGVSRGAGRSAGFRPVDLRFRFTAEAFQRIRLAAEILPLLAGWTNGVRRRDLLPFPAAEGGAEQAGPHDDAPTIGRRVADGDIAAPFCEPRGRLGRPPSRPQSDTTPRDAGRRRRCPGSEPSRGETQSQP